LVGQLLTLFTVADGQFASNQFAPDAVELALASGPARWPASVDMICGQILCGKATFASSLGFFSSFRLKDEGAYIFRCRWWTEALPLPPFHNLLLVVADSQQWWQQWNDGWNAILSPIDDTIYNEQ
jgi:hypothetical protein